MRCPQYALLILTVIMLHSCARDEAETLRVESVSAEGIISRDAVVMVAFSSGVVTPESTNVWTDTPFIEFTPSVPGKFVWQDTNRLVFSPDGPWPGDRKFKAKINTSLLTERTGKRSIEGPEEFSFSTESFTLRVAEFFYDRIGATRRVGIKANLEFTYAVDPQQILSHIKLHIDGKPQTIARVVTTSPNKIIALEVGEVTQLTKPREISISFEPELVSPESNTRIKMEKPFVYTLPPLEEVKIYGHEFGYDGTAGWIRIKLSQEIEQEWVKRSVSVEPVRDYTIQTDDQGFTLRGNFEPGAVFRLVIKKGMESVLGGKTQHDYEADIVFGNIAPSFRFASSSGVYLLHSGQKAIEIKTTNMEKLVVRVSQIFQNNLVFFIDGGRSYDYYYYYDDYYDEDYGYESGRRSKYRYHVGNYGRQLSYDTIPIASVLNQEVTTLFDLSRFLTTGYKGFYLVEIAHPAQAWRSTAKLVSVSDIGLIVKQSADEVVVFANSLVTNEPISGATISLISHNNQLIASSKTGSDGVARYANFRETARDFVLKLVTAELENDFNFINLADYGVETSRFDVGGKREAMGMYDTFLYGDRTIYRPGETVILSGIVRNLTREIPTKIPMRLKIFNPQGVLVEEQQHTLNEEGSFETKYKTQMTALSGEYRFEVYTGNNVFLSSYKVSVEDFIPDRLRLNLVASHEKARPGDKIRYELTALNFFGPPAAGRNWEFEGSFSILPYQSNNFPEFRFYDDAASNYSASPDVFTGKTDENGKATIDFVMPKNLTSTGLLRARARVAVFDESGRPVYQLAQTTVYPKDYFIGVLNRGSYYIKPNTQQTVQIVAVDMNDNAIEGFKAKVDIVRREWHSVLRQQGGSNTLRYVSEPREIPVKTDHITLGAKPVDYIYSVPRSGEYVVRVSKEGDFGYNQFSFYAYAWGTSDVTSFQIDPEARVEMVFDKPMYHPGDKARILFRAPFSGKMLVTIERNQVYSYTYLDVRDNAASMEITVDEKFLPNVYVAAVLFRKIKEMNIPLLVGHGFAPLLVEKKSNKLDVVIKAPEKMRPKRKQTVTVSVGKEKNVFVTLAAVDEGILQIKNYKTPDPYGHFYARKALETQTFNFFRDLLPEPERSSVGGGEGEMEKRVTPIGVQRFKPLAIWSGILKTDDNGEAQVMLDVPEFSGELRLMALAYKGDRFGSAQQAMKVADPVIVTPALPRFVSPGDSVVMAITAFNTTDKVASLKFAIETSGPVTAVTKSVSLDVGPNQERFINAAIKATEQVGKATVKVRTVVFGETIESTTELPVRPIAAFAADAISGFVDGVQSVSHDVPDVYLKFGRKAYVSLSPYPVANFAKELKYLVGYPHGCIEQTVSKAFPQIYLRDIAVILDPTILNTGSPTYFVNEAITKVTNMQRHDGSFEYWPGSGQASDWSTVYATHFLLEAKKAGYAVSEATLKSAQNVLAHIARSKATEDYYYWDGNKTTVRRIAAKRCLYALYVLAIAGVPEKSVMDFYRIEKSLLTHDTRFLLAAAYALSGDRKTFNELLPPQFVTEEAARTSGDNFDSPIRANALILNVLIESDLNNPNIPRYMEYLSKHYRGSSWYSTQDNAFTLLAFGKAARMAAATKLEGTVDVGGKQYTYKGGNQKIDIDPFGKKVTISMKGTGRVYYSLVVEGIRLDQGTKIEDKNLHVRREYFDRNGNPVDLQSVRQNDLLIVRLTLNSSVDRLDNVAVSDLLPGGFEIENPRITETTNYPFIRNAAHAEYIDIRDDRINIYTSFRGGSRQQLFYYLVRAVSPGRFEHAPVVAEAMYDANYYSAWGRARVTVMR